MTDETVRQFYVLATTTAAIARQLGETPEGFVALRYAETLMDSCRQRRLHPAIRLAGETLLAHAQGEPAGPRRTLAPVRTRGQHLRSTGS